jgi:hypothetical protein
LVTPDEKIKQAPLTILQYRQVPRKEGAYMIPVAKWLIHWENMTPAEATREYAKFIQATFPSFHP